MGSFYSSEGGDVIRERCEKVPVTNRKRGKSEKKIGKI
jgi:hypothetical protein